MMLRFNFKRKKNHFSLTFLILILFAISIGFNFYLYFAPGKSSGNIAEQEQALKTERYYLKGIIIKGGEKYAIFFDNTGKRYMVKEGMETGEFRVSRISKEGVVLETSRNRRIDLKWE